MNEGLTWLFKMLLAHLLSDFVLQPGSWVEDRYQQHFRSKGLYLHGFVTGLTAAFITGFRYLPVVLLITIAHILTDGWKSYRRRTATWFLIDQAIHFIVILLAWILLFQSWKDWKQQWLLLNAQPAFWLKAAAFVFVTTPAGILIGQLTQQWRDKIPDGESLASAGKWIGIAERVIILAFVLNNQFSAIGLLVAAKGIIRFNEKDRQEIKTEYLVVGTLLSIGTAILAGLIAAAPVQGQ